MRSIRVVDRFFDPGFLGVMIPLVGIVGVFTSLILRRLTWHKERMAMIEQGLDPDERRRQHKERMAMIGQGMHPDRPELEDGDLERDPELIER